MKILVTSDSHGLTHELANLIYRHKDDVDVFYHCGDSELPPSSKIMEDFKTVTGNCDFFKEGYPDDLIDVFGDFQIYVTHGHLYQVKFSLLPLKFRAEEVNANIIFYGHTHIAGCIKEGSQLFINPGSLRLPRKRKEATYLICELFKQKQVLVQFFDSNGEIIDDMTETFQL